MIQERIIPSICCETELTRALGMMVYVEEKWTLIKIVFID